MSWKISGLVWELDLTHSQQSVLLAMADHAEHDGSKVFPSVARIAWKTSYSERQVRRVMSELRKIKILVIVKEASRYRPREYKIDISAGKTKRAFRDDIVSSLGDEGDSTPTSRPDTNIISKPSNLKTASIRDDIATSTRPDIAVSPDSPLTIKEQSLKDSRSNDRGKSKKKRDPLLDHPAIVKYKDEARLNVYINWRKEVAETVGDDPKEVERWKAVVHDWIGCGWNKQNVKGMLEVFSNPEREATDAYRKVDA